MKGLTMLPAIILVLFLFAIGFYAQEPSRDSAGDKQDNGLASLAAISSTGSGGLWSSPSTWAGGVVPGPGDDVTISPGTAVLIDTDVTVGNVIVGTQVGFNPGILTFEPFAPHAFAVSGNLTIEGLGLFTTPTSNSTVTGHTITVGGNLTNNGILDLSTNNNLAGAGLVFTGASNNTFGGGGSMTDVRTITVNKGTSTANTLELTVLNFTVQGSTTDGAASGYLTLTNGFFKISGSFSGNHRTFAAAAYNIPGSAGFWLNNPNYTVTAQTGDAMVTGRLTISAGVYNVGTAGTDALRGGDFGGVIIMEGGSLNVSGPMRRGQFPGASYRQRGGTTTICIAGNVSPCYNMAGTGTGGSFVIQTPNPVPNESLPDMAGALSPLLDNGMRSPTATTLRFGNAATFGTGIFTCIADFGPSIAVDTTSGPHTVKLSGAFRNIFRNVNIGAGGTLDIGDPSFHITGETFINNGTFKVKSTSFIGFFDPMGAITHDVAYSGTGSFSGPAGQIYLMNSNLTLDPGVASIRTMGLRVDASNIVNAGRLTLGNNDNNPSTVHIEDTGTFDSSPGFDLGTGGQRLIYSSAGTRSIGPELNPSRQLTMLTHDLSPGTLSFTGGDITLNGALNMMTGVIDTGSSRLVHQSGDAFSVTGYVKGTLVRRFTDSNPTYNYFVGDNHYARVQIIASSVTGSADVAVSPHDVTLAGLPPATSASFSWDVVQTGTMTSSMALNYDNSDVSGNESNYRAYRSTASSPIVVASTVSTPSNLVTATGLTDLTAGWGISERPPPISIGGSVLTSGGTGIRNAILTLTGGNLASPRVAQTGSFGTYNFGGVEAGLQYTVTVSAKRNRFMTSSQVVNSMTTVTDLNFTANPQE